MASTIKLKNSTTVGNTPSSLETGEIAINVADGNLFYGSASAVKQDFALTNITASGNISASGFISASAFVGDGSGLTGLSSAAITTYNNSGDNRILTSVNSTTVNGEANLTFNGSGLSVTGHITASGNISASGNIIIGNPGVIALNNALNENYIAYDGAGFNYKGHGKFQGNLTASGNISASGTIVGSNLSGTNTGDQDLSSYIQASQTSSFSTATGVEDNADVTDTSNVTSAGALMDSELTEIATVKALTKAGISGSFNAASASFSTRVTANDAKVSYTDAAVKTKISAEGVISGSATNVRSFLNVENGADVTDTSNVTSAGALMDSEVTNLAQVKSFDSSDYATAAQGTKADTAIQPSQTGSFLTAADTGSFITTAQTSSFSTATGVEDNADVTDTTNVTSAGALMDSELTEIATVKALTKAGISGSFTADSASFSTRVTANDAKLTANTSNVTSAGALMDSELAEIATVKALTKADISGSFTAASSSFSTRVTLNDAKVSYTDAAVTSVINAAGILSSSEQISADISGAFTATSAALAADIVSAGGGGGTTTNALTVDNATLQLNSGTTFDGSAARTISIKDGGVDSDALAANIIITHLTASAISASGTITADSFTGNGLSINGSSNSHIEVGEYNVGFDTVGANTLFITGSGLIVSGAMADQNHHNMVKIGNVELIDINTLVSPNEFLIHNVSSFKITSGSDGGDIANDDGRLFEHNGTDFKLYRNNSEVIGVDATTTTFNNTNVSFIATPFFRAEVADPSSNGHFLYTLADPGSSPQETKSVNVGDVFKVLTGAVTASAVSASGTITAATLDAAAVSDTLAAAIVAEIDNDEIPIAKLAEDSISGVALGNNLNNLTVDNATLQLNSGTTFNGSAARTISIKDGGVDSDALAANISVTQITASAAEITTNKLAKTSNTDADHQGDVVFFGSTTSMDSGKIYHYNSSGNWELANATDNTKSTGLLAVALGAASDTNGMLLKGMVTLDHDPGAVGDKLFLRTSNGLALNSAPGSTNNVIRVIGYCLDASNGQIYFNPSNDHIIHA